MSRQGNPSLTAPRLMNDGEMVGKMVLVTTNFVGNTYLVISVFKTTAIELSKRNSFL